MSTGKGREGSRVSGIGGWSRVEVQKEKENQMRTVKYTEDEFMAAYKDSTDLYMIAAKLNLSLPTVYNYIRKFGLKTKTSKNKEQSRLFTEKLTDKIFNEYRGQKTIKSLAHEYSTTRSAIRYYLKLGLPRHYRIDHKKAIYPKPGKLVFIKVMHELELDETLFDDPEELFALTGVHPDRIKSYLLRVYNARIKKERRHNG